MVGHGASRSIAPLIVAHTAAQRLGGSTSGEHCGEHQPLAFDAVHPDQIRTAMVMPLTNPLFELDVPVGTP